MKNQRFIIGYHVRFLVLVKVNKGGDWGIVSGLLEGFRSTLG